MTKFLLSAAILATTATISYAGPLGLFGRRCQCQDAEQPQRQPIFPRLNAFIAERPVATFTAQTVEGIRTVIEARPVRTLVGGCVNGVCPAK